MNNANQIGTPGTPQISGALLPEPGGRARVFLLPGQLQASKDATQVVTILGSCVSICLWDARLKIGGVNHFLLPAVYDGQRGTSRFGDIATRTLLEMLNALGSRPRDLVAKIFGGAAVLRTGATSATLGQKNVESALKMMKGAGIKIEAQDTGGTKGRKIVFHTDTGNAWARYI